MIRSGILKPLAALTGAALLLPLFFSCGKGEKGPEMTTPTVTEAETGTAPATETPTLGALSELLKESALPELPEGELVLPENSTRYDRALALRSLRLSLGQTAEEAAELFRRTGLTVLLQKNYDKDPADPAHTCAYTVGSAAVTVEGRQRTLIVVALRGTEAGEWYSNFDFAPSRKENAVFAENFLFAAENAFLGLQEVLKGTEDPLILVCGYSRGAACANLLGLLLNASVGADRVYGYTFATPATVRGDTGVSCDNLFHHINSADLVPGLPLAAWSYRRAGTDILLSGDAESEAGRERILSALSAVAPTLSAYYRDRHAWDAAGLSENGLTAFELMLTVSQSLLSSSGSAHSGTVLSLIGEHLSPESDLYPLWELLQKGLEEDGAGLAAVVRQHLPSVYWNLLTEAAEEENGGSHGLH